MRNMSQNEAMVRAMVQNAKTSSVKENLENAVMAQEKFMFAQSNRNDMKQSVFLDRIKKRSDEMRQAVSE